MSWFDELRRLLHVLRHEPPNVKSTGEKSCHEAAEFLFDWLDGELPPDLARAVGAHLETCAHCYPKLLFERSFLEAVSRVSSVSEVPPDLRRRVLATLEAEGFSVP